MYGDGNSSRMVGDIISSTTKITDGLSEATGVNIRAVLSGFLNSKTNPNNEPVPKNFEEIPAED